MLNSSENEHLSNQAPNKTQIDIQVDQKLMSYGEYSSAVNKHIESTKEVLLYRDPDLAPSLQEVWERVSISLKTIAPPGSCSMIASYTHGMTEGQIVLSQLYYGETRYLAQDLKFYERRGYLSKRDLRKKNASGPDGEAIVKATNMDWSCDESTLQELVKTEIDPFGNIDKQPIINEMLIIRH